MSRFRGSRWMLALMASFALLAAACGSDDDGGSDTGDDGGEEVEEFEAGTTMADLQEAGEIKIGVKYDVRAVRLQESRNG